RLRKAGLATLRLVPVPSVEAPALLVTPEHPIAAAYAIEDWGTPPEWLRRQRNRLVRLLLSGGRFPDVSRMINIGLREPGAPVLITAAGEFGVPADAGWYLTLGHGDALTRCVFQLFEPGGHEPAWVLKFSRVAGYSDSFDRDERGLTLAADSRDA